MKDAEEKQVSNVTALKQLLQIIRSIRLENQIFEHLLIPFPDEHEKLIIDLPSRISLKDFRELTSSIYEDAYIICDCDCVDLKIVSLTYEDEILFQARKLEYDNKKLIYNKNIKEYNRTRQEIFRLKKEIEKEELSEFDKIEFEAILKNFNFYMKGAA